MTDQDIVRQIRNTDLAASEDALRLVYKKCYFVCEQMITKNNGSKEDAKDIFHDALVVFYNNAKKSDFELKSKISTYLYGVCRNLWYQRLRESKKYVEVSEDYLNEIEGGILVPDRTTQTETAVLIANLLEKSGQKCLALLKMFYFEKMRMKEIAEAFGFASDQVAKNQKVRCLKKLRAIAKNTAKYKDLLQTQ